MKSQFDGKCHDFYGGCGAEWKIGDEIEKNGLKNSKGNDAFCLHGMRCPGNKSAYQQGTQSGRPEKATAMTNENYIQFAESAAKSFIKICKEEGIEPADMSGLFSAFENTNGEGYE